MSQAKSTVQVSIVASLGQGFAATFTSADKRVQALSSSVKDAQKVLGNVDAFRKQQEAVKQAGYSWQAAKAKADQFREAIAAQGAPTRKQTSELNKLEAAAGRAGEKFAKQRESLGAMGRDLQKAGVNTGKLTAEYQRLTTQLNTATAAHDKMEASLARQHKLVSAMGSTWRGIAGAAGGMMAAGAVVRGPMSQAMTYDQQLTYMADTAAAGRGPGAYRASKTQISNAINEALQLGGGKREDAATALQTMIASGKFEFGDALAQLPMVARTAFASGASSADIAQTAIALKNYGINDVGGQFDKLLRAGQLGNFELKDMAKSLPQQLALAKSAGYAGTSGLTQLLALNQLSMKTAGQPEEAGRNVVNLLQKLSSSELADEMSREVKLQKGDPRDGKKGGFGWSTYMMRNREKGISAVESLVMLAERQVNGDPRYQQLQKRLAGAGNDAEKKETLGAMTNLVEGSNVGKLIHDRQALMAALAALYGKNELKGLESGIANSGGIVAQSSANVRGEAWAKQIDASNALARANEQAYNSVSTGLGKVLDTGSALAEAFPKVTSAAYGAATGLTALAALFGVGGGLAFLMRGGAVAGGAAAAGGAGAAAGAVGAAGAGAMAARVGILGRLGVAGMLGWGALEGAKAMGLPEVDADKGREALKKGDWLGASTRLPAGEFLGALWDKATSSNTDAAKAAADAAKAASDAATAAQSRPNVTQNNSYNITLQAPPQAGALEFSQQLEKAMRARDAKAAADLRSGFLSAPQY